MSVETQNSIEEIMEYFDFDRVHKAMVALNWTWFDVGAPTIDDLKRQARRLLDEVASKIENSDEGQFYIATGGFKASARRYEKSPGGILLELTFEVSRWTNTY